jgi:hypothetical protein
LSVALTEGRVRPGRMLRRSPCHLLAGRPFDGRRVALAGCGRSLTGRPPPHVNTVPPGDLRTQDHSIAGFTRIVADPLKSRGFRRSENSSSGTQGSGRRQNRGGSLGSWPTDRCSPRGAVVNDTASAAGSTDCRHPPGKKRPRRARAVAHAHPAVQEYERFAVKDENCSGITNFAHRRPGTPKRQETPWSAP